MYAHPPLQKGFHPGGQVSFGPGRRDGRDYVPNRFEEDNTLEAQSDNEAESQPIQNGPRTGNVLKGKQAQGRGSSTSSGSSAPSPAPSSTLSSSTAKTPTIEISDSLNKTTLSKSSKKRRSIASNMDNVAHTLSQLKTVVMRRAERTYQAEDQGRMDKSNPSKMWMFLQNTENCKAERDCGSEWREERDERDQLPKIEDDRREQHSQMFMAMMLRMVGVAGKDHHRRLTRR
ncbi:hypothetical protein BJ742DRAFT_886329 [Cladochytrium replicatum]|nr:hypothetical protein BJ742DRAFT_886329 [Cladochytrium replicatum]